MFSPLRSVAVCCFALTLPAPALADLVLAQAQTKTDACQTPGGCDAPVTETLVLDPTAKPGGGNDPITIRSTNPTVLPPIQTKPAEPPTRAPDPIVSKPPVKDRVITLPAVDPTVRPPVLGGTPPTTVPDKTAGTRPPLLGGTKPPLLGGGTPAPRPVTPVPVEPASGTDVTPFQEMPYITFAPAPNAGDYEISLVDSVRGTGRLRVSTDYGPVFCSGFVFGPTVVATSYACVPGILEDPQVGATQIEEIRIVFDHIFPNQRLWTAQGYELRLDMDLSSKESGLAILHIVDPDQSFASDRIQRVGQSKPDPRAPLFMLSHPRGGSMQFHHCNAVASNPAYQEPKTFEHDCESDLGDLGAPIFDAATGAVVGMHLSRDYYSGRRLATHSVDLANWIGDQQ